MSILKVDGVTIELSFPKCMLSFELSQDLIMVVFTIMKLGFIGWLSSFKSWSVFLNSTLQEVISLVQLSIVAAFEILHIVEVTLLPGHVVVF